MFNNIKRKIKDFERFKEILEILFEGELRVLVINLGFTKFLSKKHIKKSINKKPEILIKTIEKLGPTFIKLGQLLSTRPDLVSEEYLEELKKLQDKVSPINFHAVKDIIQRELKKPLGKVFSYFEEEPIAAASIAQVHLAKIRNNDKRFVAVKIQRPGIEEIMKSDIEILEFIAKRIEKQKKYSYLNAFEIVEEFKNYTSKELDMTIEANNMKKFYAFYEEKKQKAKNNNEEVKILIPKIYDELCTHKMIVMDYFKGTPLTNLAALKKRNVNLKELTKTGFKAVMDQVFELGMFHADAHPGNLLMVRTKTKQKKIVDKLAFLDFGIIGKINDNMKINFLKALDALVNEDDEKITKAILSFGEPKKNFNKNKLRAKIKTTINNWQGSSIREEKLSNDFYHILRTAIKEGLKIDPNILLLAKGYLVIEGTANYLYPELDMSLEINKYFQKHKKLLYNPVKKNLLATASSFGEFIRQVPIYAENINNVVEKGVKLDFDKKEFNNIISNYDLEMNKRVMATIAGSIFIGSSLLAYLKPELTIMGMKLFEAGFLLFFLTLILLLVYSLKTHKYLKE